jgi:hypothetical protein
MPVAVFVQDKPGTDMIDTTHPSSRFHAPLPRQAGNASRLADVA